LVPIAMLKELARRKGSSAKGFVTFAG